ncbi:HTH-type transcriptional activator RhaS [Pleomorphomonas sp. T1.2MG-36]|uniref:helix-turn-helix domain-containing protein n=1 Tax=Pleomorphomonas sp. T1.2MG-36 TaxID=3041167 RepID=UPI0024774DE2|nr:AraC family transcriptional regulator [Pleomorphomonas sp. T1.2MG-36]CAI9417876.1 HTH-type transcriptional activator RhaS [Pleomorphomonas sp. T1.2MG-36]
MKALATPHWRLELLPASPYCVRYVVADNEIGFAYDCQTGEHSIGTDRRSSFKVRANSLAVRAKGWDVYSRSRRGGEYLRLVCQDLEIRRGCHDFIDERAAGIAHRLRSLLLTHADPLDCEALVLALRDRVDDLSETRNEPIPGWITPQRLRRIDDLIDLRLSENLLVTDLSAALGLSTRYFARAFHRATGRSPRDYIIECRLRRARELIETTDHSLADIALECGFSSHAHMTSQFVRRVGVTPSALRSG